VEVQVVMADEADRLSTRDKGDTQRIPPGGTPGYGIVNLRAGWSPADNIDLTLSLENLLDHDYRIHGSGSNMPGFNAIFAASVRF
jgi:hemoglobin/transferrin/lactoferrin receptor protein